MLRTYRHPTPRRGGASSPPPRATAWLPSRARGCDTTCSCPSSVSIAWRATRCAGKRRQEQLLSNSPVPVTIQRVTQFRAFAGMVIGWRRQGQVATVPPLLVPPIAAADVGDVLAESATDTLQTGPKDCLHQCGNKR